MTESTVSRRRAHRRLLQSARPQEAVLVSPHEAVGRVAAQDVVAHCDVPEQACSVRDGFGVRSQDLQDAKPLNPISLKVTQTIRAEAVDVQPVKQGECARVLTGGMVPPGADAVLAEEDVEVTDDSIRVSAPVRLGWFIRKAGGEIAKGDVIAHAGEEITPQAAAVMMRTRINSIQVHTTPHVRIIALGSELSDPCCCGEEDCDGGRFPADNIVLTTGLLGRSGCEVVQSGVLPDNKARLTNVLSDPDLPEVVITTGGTGRSERDFARSCALEAGFKTVFDRLDIRPGRNMFAAHRGKTMLFCLPGPPAAVFACYHAVILPFLRHLRGFPEEQPVTARLEKGISARPGGEWLVTCGLYFKEGSLIAVPYVGKEVPPMLAIGRAKGVAVLSGGDSILPGGQVEIISPVFA
ncbi:MoeA domain protein domain I and II [Pseudodesulfovibrio profundus]|uniref:Molybdopterin molybdenumtransferase n=1 Tax=Pseudodesulfovibrio profundus TaxID=57320 RepID=A0A2C8F9S8_9BACT|nr:molybdopterin molybdotransferase MoeA [Pseudodesulfovibrio profundus]SOB59181.1 MoeA domain protein domain I and II [Pseudodesulfovibrio profundus]